MKLQSEKLNSLLKTKPQTPVKVLSKPKQKEKLTKIVNSKQPKNALLKAMVSGPDAVTQNGAATYSTSLSAVVDLFGMGKALRARPTSAKVALFNKAWAEDKLLALKCLFNIRDVRGGGGERQSFRDILTDLAQKNGAVVVKNLENVVKMGRWDDLFVLFNSPIHSQVVDFIFNQLQKDLEAYDKGESVSLLAKWLPSINGSNKEGRDQAYMLANTWGLTPKQYRKILSALRAHIDVTEVKMCANQWNKINYSAVPSKASLTYKDAFREHDGARYTKFLSSVEKGEAKINAGTLFPYELVKQANGNATVEAQWKALPDYLEGNDRNILVLADTSASMTWVNNALPYYISISLAIYTAQRNKGAFNNYYIAYSTEPTLVHLKGKTLAENVSLAKHCYGGSTDLQKAFASVLSFAVKNKVPAKDMPEQVIIITDAEFNNPQNGRTNLDEIRSQYNRANYPMPQLVFWNVNSIQNNVPARADDNGVVLVSGASPTVFLTLLSGKQYSPIDQMLETLNGERYKTVVV